MRLKVRKIKQFIDEKIMSNVLLRICFQIVLIFSVSSVSYAYFNADVEGEGKQMVMTTSDMRIAFTDTESINQKGMIPGDTITKTFTVTNEAESSVDYKINWEYLINNFVNKQYLVYTVTSTNNGGNLTQSQVPDSEEHINIINNITIASGVTQEYTLTVTYLDSGSAQDEDRNKSLIGKLEVTDLDGNSILPETSTGPSSSSVPLDRNLYGLTVRNLMNEIYPVGSIYTSVSSDNPSAKFGGTWIPYGQGRTLVGVGSGNDGTSNKTFAVESTGGKYSSTLVVANLPKHTHSIPALTGTAASNGAHTHRAGYKRIDSYGSGALDAMFWNSTYSSGEASTNSAGAHTHTVTTVANTSGDGGTSLTSTAFTNEQPYITVYMWKRTA